MLYAHHSSIQVIFHFQCNQSALPTTSLSPSFIACIISYPTGCWVKYNVSYKMPSHVEKNCLIYAHHKHHYCNYKLYMYSIPRDNVVRIQMALSKMFLFYGFEDFTTSERYRTRFLNNCST